MVWVREMKVLKDTLKASRFNRSSCFRAAIFFACLFRSILALEDASLEAGVCEGQHVHGLYEALVVRWGLASWSVMLHII
jgi:hypothetical protein